ncbi:tRNA lysidine(34) synthetase TilS, partial [Chloroflexota bacterium]
MSEPHFVVEVNSTSESKVEILVMVKKRQMASLGQGVLHFIKENKMVMGQHPLLVAVSGGPDSVCLLHILVELQEKLDIKLHVAHLNHQLRGADSEADAQYVTDLAQRLNIPATVEQRDVKGFQKQWRISLEETAREVRYNFLAEVVESIGAYGVAVGHTFDDHIETILMHLVRGTGINGLRGIKSCGRWQSSTHSLMVLRPLLEVRRQETAEYCRSQR